MKEFVFQLLFLYRLVNDYQIMCLLLLIIRFFWKWIVFFLVMQNWLSVIVFFIGCFLQILDSFYSCEMQKVFYFMLGRYYCRFGLSRWFFSWNRLFLCQVRCLLLVVIFQLLFVLLGWLVQCIVLFFRVCIGSGVSVWWVIFLWFMCRLMLFIWLFRQQNLVGLGVLFGVISECMKEQMLLFLLCIELNGEFLFRCRLKKLWLLVIVVLVILCGLISCWKLKLLCLGIVLKIFIGIVFCCYC